MARGIEIMVKSTRGGFFLSELIMVGEFLIATKQIESPWSVDTENSKVLSNAEPTKHNSGSFTRIGMLLYSPVKLNSKESHSIEREE